VIQLLSRARRFLLGILSSGTGASHRPRLGAHNESNIDGLYVIGDLAGAPVIKMAMAQGYEVIERIAARPDARGGDPGVYDVAVVGAGAAGLNAVLEAKERGLSHILLEKEKVANTIENFPEGKWVYAEPDAVPPKGKLWLDGATKEDLVRRWHEIVRANQLNVHTEEPLTALRKEKDGTFALETPRGTYRARRVVLATGQRGNPRKLGVPGEDREEVYHRLYSPRHYHGEDILVVGGGNSAVEAALVLSEQNRVVVSYRRGAFERLFKDNARKLDEAVAAGRIQVIFNSEVRALGEGRASLVVREGGAEREEQVPYRHAFVLIGAELPVEFLRKLGLRMENEWKGSLLGAATLTVLTLLGLWIYGGKSPVELPAWAGGLAAGLSLAAMVALGLRGDRFQWLGISFLVCYTVYGVKVGKGQELWPYRGWGYDAFAFFGRPWSFWYTVLYTILMTVFGLLAMKRWGLDRKDKFQIWRYVSLISFQWIFFFIVPEFLFQWAVEYQWVGEKLASDPSFAGNAWRSYGLVYAWPLFFYTFFYNPHDIWVIWGVVLAFGVIPVIVLFHGKRYCSWVCGCGGLAETLGDRWRHLAPKGKASQRWERMGSWVLVLAVVVTGAVLLADLVDVLRKPSRVALDWYRLGVDVWLVGILPVTLYPFLGGKVWCRYWCPLAKLMEIQSRLFSKLRWSRFSIHANDKCIACGECTRNCQVGIDVMSYALKQDVLDNRTSSCIGCGICVTVCPMDVLHFRKEARRQSLPVVG
jgi:thioredoxin reductase/polyferredoxin